MKGRFHSYLNSAENIITQFRGETPLAVFLKNYFKKDPKYGSRDRKTISALCYSFYRVGKAIPIVDLREKIVVAYFICADIGNELLSDLGDNWNALAYENLNVKLEFLQSRNITISLNEIFPCKNHLGGELKQKEQEFIYSHVHQSDFFLRVRPGKLNIVREQLIKLNVQYSIDGDTLRLPSGTPAEKIFNIDKDIIIQDLSSQKTGSLIKEALNILSARGDKPNIWDCCAASGGKSILAFDLDNNIEITVSDIRKSIIENLIERFGRTGIHSYKYFIQDLTKNLPDLNKFNFIIADVPCSGSGTWGRTPEEMYFFNEGELREYANRQKSIVDNISNSLAPGTLFLYITCSVFRDENEVISEYMENSKKMKLLIERYIYGYADKADTMYAALFIAEG